MKIYIVYTDVVNDVTYSRKSVNTYDFYDMTLSTGKQRRHMIKNVMTARVLTLLREYVTSLTTSVTTM